MQITYGAGAIPDFLQRLIGLYCIDESDIRKTTDGFVAVGKSISAILEERGINTIPEENGQAIECRNFLDDWFLYCVPGKDGVTYSLFKMREQEYELENGILADGDTPGATISFIAFQTHFLEDCLLFSTDENRLLLWKEINRVVSYPGQKHDPNLKAYFIRPEAQGPYLVAQMYVQQIKSFAVDGILPVPKAYAALYQARHTQRKAARIPDFIDANNHAAGRVVCDHKYIYIQDTENLTDFEKLAILATHTGNVSIHSFAAEVRYHAMFLVWYAKLPIPFLKSTIYASAIRADMTIEDKEFEGPAPFYDMNSRFVKEQIQANKYTLL